MRVPALVADFHSRAPSDRIVASPHIPHIAHCRDYVLVAKSVNEVVEMVRIRRKTIATKGLGFKGMKLEVWANRRADTARFAMYRPLPRLAWVFLDPSWLKNMPAQPSTG